jgi:hypothetical protein
MRTKTVILVVLSLLVLVLAASCKKTYLYLSEEVRDNKPARFAIQEAYYLRGKSIALYAGRFQLTPSDSVVLHLSAQGSVTGFGEAGVATLDFDQVARVYIVLPNRLTPGEYDIGRNGVCEITGSLNYRQGENLFVCQSGRLVIDSLKGDKIFGIISGTYLNAGNQSLSLEGAVKAKPR